MDPTAQNNSAIKFSSTYGHLEIVKLLLNCKDVDPTIERNWPIRMSASNGHLGVVQLLLAREGEKNEEKKKETKRNWPIRMSASKWTPWGQRRFEKS